MRNRGGCHLVGHALGGTCVGGDVRGSGAGMCGHWCAYKHVCVPMYASMFSLYMCCACT